MIRDGLDTRKYYTGDIKAEKIQQERAKAATANEIQRDARVHRMRLYMRPGKKDKGCRLDELYAYLDRERARRSEYIKAHLGGGRGAGADGGGA